MIFGMTRWRLLLDAAPDGARNMALDRALLEACESSSASGGAPEPVLRLYGWARPTVSAGRHQGLADACDLAWCSESGIDAVARPSGGRAVLHDDEVTYAVIAPATGAFAGAGITRASSAIAGALVAALRRLGADVAVVRGVAALVPRSVRLACFASASRSELTASGRKICGSAQVRLREGILQHGSIPLSLDPMRHAAALGAPVPQLALKAASLEDAIGRRPDAAEVRAALVLGFAETFGAEVEPDGPTDEEGARTEALDREWRADPRRWIAAPAAIATRA